MIKKKKVAGKIEYTETYRAVCGHEAEVITWGYKMSRKQIASKRRGMCLKCQLEALLR
jgi:hypothetical protein